MAEQGLVGRSEELAEVREIVRRTRQGIGACLTIDGPAGIGKSRLLREGIAEATASGVTVITGRVTELDAAAPLSPLLAALRGHVDLGELNPVADNRYWLINRLTELIEAAARVRPVLIVLDDLHWADELTVLALRDMVPALRTSPVGWLLALRPLPRRSAVRDALRWIATEHGRQLHLGPLNRREMAEVCQNLLGAVPSPELLTLAERSGGNPFLLEELITSLRIGDRIRVAGGLATIGDGSLPPGFVVAAHRRLLELASPVRQLLDAAAVLGRPFSLHEAAALVGKPAGDMVEPAAEAVTAGILVETGDELMFRHDLLREATYRSLAAPVRQALHREAVSVVRAEGRPAVEAAQHLIRVARKGDAHAAEVLHEAASDLKTSAPSAAADLLLHLLELLDDADASRPARIAEAVDALATAGRLTEARQVGEKALGASLAPTVEAGILAGLAEMFKHAGQDRLVVDYANRGLVRAGVPDDLRARLLAVKSHALLYLDDDGSLEEADEVAREAITVGERTGESAAVVVAAVARSVTARYRGDLGQATALAAQAVGVAEQAGGQARIRLPRLWLGRALISVDQLDEADTMLEHGQREAERLGAVWSMPLWHHGRTQLHIAAGRLDDAVAEAEAGLATSDRMSAGALDGSLLSTLAWLAIRRGKTAEAAGYLRRIPRRRDADSPPKASALLYDVRGRGADAVQLLAPIYQRLEAYPGILTFDPWTAPYLVRLAKCTGATQQAQRAMRAARQLADLNPGVTYLAGMALRAESLLSGDTDALDEAILLLRKGPRRLSLASALEDRGYLDQLAGRRTDAVAILDEAATLYTQILAEGDAARAHRRLRELGVRRRLRPAGGRARTGWGSLTESELKVVRLVAEGKTNRAVATELFLSPHTVDSHLRHAFVKLGVASRVELTRAFLEREPGSAG
ncbi:AAA family ATPase [Hamadaea sp. NPDC051192]|uniref:helix-turn-helix transcriptional regulator n=1 Tax=Hamadaea sp. NPDC051192 TaxID=3154940 RepID=UPI0034224249